MVEETLKRTTVGKHERLNTLLSIENAQGEVEFNFRLLSN